MGEVVGETVEEVLAKWEVSGEIARGWRLWPPARKAVAAEQVELTHAGKYLGEIDGFAGPLTLRARVIGGEPVELHPLPISPHTGWPLQRDCDKFYGNPSGSLGKVNSAWYAENVTHVRCPWELHMDSLKLRNIEIHRKCADSLTRVLAAIWAAAGSQEQIEKLHYDRYSGSFNYRLKRSGSTISMHAYACAIDWDSEENEQGHTSHLFTAQSLLVVKFREEGWIWGGEWSGASIDAMHVQAARVR